MARTLKLLTEIVETAQQQQQADHEQLRKLKAQVSSTNEAASPLLQKQIRALRETIANSTEDLNDLALELEEAKVFAASERGKAKILEQQDAIAAMDAAVGVCIQTATEADTAMFNAIYALQRHRLAHEHLNCAMGQAYNGLTLGVYPKPDPFHDQLFLLSSYSSVKNCGYAVGQFVMDAIAGLELDQHIKVEGMTFDSKKYTPLAQEEMRQLNRCQQRIRDLAKRCGVETLSVDDPKVAGLFVLTLKFVRSLSVWNKL